jgi:hypothetical protein
MYTISKNLKLTSIILMLIGFISLTYGFLAAPSNYEEAQKMYPEYGNSINEVVKVSDSSNDKVYNVQHDENHKEHLLHKLQNRPWAALYVAALFFFFISLGTIAFYAI